MRKPKKDSKKLNEIYPRIYELGLVVIREPVDYIPSKKINKILRKLCLTKKFSDYYGIQTGLLIDGEIGFYAWDVEAVLERIFSGKLIGTQKFWD